VEGGTFNRINDARYPAAISTFALDIFEVTVGRFRKFVEALPASAPAVGHGAHPRIPASGWRADWTLGTRESLIEKLHCHEVGTWTDAPASNEQRPIDCVDWYEAFAFCAWDGGWLPTEAEWNYAAAGGSEQRVFPWSQPPDSTLIDRNHATYACPESCITAVGSLPAGRGRFGQMDLAGNLEEWVMDVSEPLANTTCVNCAKLGDGERVVRGGSYFDIAQPADGLRTTSRKGYAGGARSAVTGLRCARSAAGAVN
jgi:formylglycine-generating enzyme required for sulfatase activity